MTTNEFERDLNDTSFLRRPGRIDLVVLQNTADAGDGHPGLQRCFRNYLHEGGMEKDLDLVGHGIKGTSVDINNAELQQLSNIGASVITSSIWSQIANIGAVAIDVTQWGYLGELDQALKQTSNVAFGQITMSGDIIMGSDDITFSAGGTVDGVDVSVLKSDFDTHKANDGSDHSFIDQSVISGASPTFANPIVTNLNLADDIIHVGDTDNLISFGTDIQDYQTGGSSRMDISDSGVRFGGANVRITGIINNDSLGTSDVVLCTQGNVKAYTDAQAAHGIASDDLLFSNDTERSSDSSSYVKLKEITMYRSVSLRVYWEMKSGQGGVNVDSKVYVNGVAVGGLKSTTSSTYITLTEDITVNAGDLVQIYGKRDGSFVWIRYQRLKFIEYVSTAGY